ncbi:hypothetical protein Nepgr_002724 [Nepenthes gracilis]|uniref:Transmembrane protein n=1 Tax=Nepenthes gracilis TaxID=150966 RepID=A0AAD3P477_NEPGR|nr:hypothetical protein Nepgr_002724 [Nepenthes gracilis]
MNVLDWQLWRHGYGIARNGFLGLLFSCLDCWFVSFYQNGSFRMGSYGCPVWYDLLEWLVGWCFARYGNCTPFFMEIKLVIYPGLWRRVGHSGLSGMNGGIGRVASRLSDGATGWFDANGWHAFLKCWYEHLCWFGHFGDLVPFARYASLYLAWLAFLVLSVWLVEDGLVSARLVRMVHCERFSAV